MATIKFGHTWWGKNWLQALAYIDFSNRLPRGQRYARNGSVVNIDIKGSDINARVQGTRSQPYKVKLKLWEFSTEEKKTIAKLISESPYYLSQLEAKTLPIELLEDLSNKKIRLFPRSWKDLNMKCSCPDWAVPCKHLASIVYIIANEIDKNPFLVFLLHDFDLLESIHPEGALDDEGILDISSLLVEEEKDYCYDSEALNQIDYSVIPDLSLSIDGLLTDFPLFYLKNDFKKILGDSRTKMGQLVKKHIKKLELTEDLPPVLYTSGEFQLLKGKNRYSGFLKKGSHKLPFSKDEPKELIHYIENLSVGDLSVYPNTLSYLIMIHSFVIKLLEKHALVPEIYSFGEKSYLIRWIPPLFNREIRQIFENLLASIPISIVKYDNKALDQKEQLHFLISFMSQYYFDSFLPVKNAQNDPILSLFFSGNEYKPNRFEERENARTIELWLGRLFTRPINKTPIIKVEELETGKNRETFHFDIQIRDRRTKDVGPQALNSFLEEEDPEKRPLLRDLNLLSTYLPTINSYLKEKKPVSIQADIFVKT